MLTSPATPMTLTQRSLIVLFFSMLVALVASACSGSDSENVVPLDAPAPGVVYVATSTGDIQAVAPADADASVLLVASGTGAQPVVDLSPGGPSAMHALVADPDNAFVASAVAVTEAGLTPLDTVAAGLSCLDPHGAATMSIAHRAEPAPGGAEFAPVVLSGDGVPASGFDMTSIACPRWTAGRDTVATAVPTRDADPSSIVTIVQTSDGERHEIGFTQCGTTPTSFSPDDEFLAIALTCYSASWENSGLYLLPVADLADLGDLSELTRLGAGLYGRTSWHPDGDWIAAVHAEAIERQNIAQNLSAQPRSLQLIEVDTRQTVELELADGETPFAVAWLARPIG